MRLIGWEVRLANRIKQAGSKDFAWGQHDCCLFAADCVLDITGRDLMGKFRGKYKTEAGAAKMIKRAGGIANCITETMGDPVDVRVAKRGDLVMYGDIVGVCVGSQFVAPLNSGVYFGPMSQATMAWSVK